MKTHTLQQGSQEWLAHRRNTRNASEASVMMSASPYVTRAELIRVRSVGLEREFSDYVQKNVLDRGHKVEPLLRALAEKTIGEELYPVTATSPNGYLGASFDGVTLLEDVIFEAKQASAEKMAMVRDGILPPQDKWQVVQQFAVCESAAKCYYFVGDGTEENTVYMIVNRSDIEADIETLLASWAQFDRDVAAYVPEPEVLPAPAGRAPDQLPALHIEVTGMVTASNLAQWKDAAIAVFKGISTDLQTDQDFADADKTVKWCADIESQLKAAKAHALSQTASIDELFRTIDAISEEARAKRLELDKLVKARKESIKVEIITAGAAAVRAHYDAINATLGAHAFQPAQSLQLNLGAAIKGMRSIKAMRDAIDSAVAAEKIEASQRAERIRANVAILTEHAEHRHLFADAVQLCASKSPEDLRNLVFARIAEHEETEAARRERERERIRAEEAARIERERAQAEEAARREREQPAPEPIKASASTSPAQTTGKRISLGEINKRIAPLSITAEGMSRLGFDPIIERTTKLYALADMPRIYTQMMHLLEHAE